jgi:Spy/CpxP family protein refolding chaperone
MKVAIFIFLFFLSTLCSSAQVERKPAVRSDSGQAVNSDNTVDRQTRKDRLKELNLTREQKIKMKELMQANKAAKDAIENNAQLSEVEKKKQLRELQKAQAQKIQGILTPEQIEKFKASKQNNP